jgi:glucuronokinase
METFFKEKAYARAGFLGNPSDGYFGKTIAICVRNFYAEAEIKPSRTLEIRPCGLDRSVYTSLSVLVKELNTYGYYGGVRLIKAAIKKFYDYCTENKIPIESKNFTLSYQSDIPRQLGLGGSSAIITAVFRVLMRFYNVEIPLNILPSLILEAEREELGINAGFMDRVAQVFEGCVYMDLNKEIIRSQGHGLYEELDPLLLPPLYLSYKPSLGKVSGKVLNDIRLGYERGDRFVRETLERIAEKAEIGKEALRKRDYRHVKILMNENFDLRSRIMKISKPNMEMIDTARHCGASAKFAGSGGAVIGTYEDEETYIRLKKKMEKIQAKVIKPIIG